MIPTALISDAQFQRARDLDLPVRIEGTAFVLGSATRPELTRHHRVEFDSADEPSAFSCSCEAHRFGSPCWAAARALDVLVLLAAHGVRICAPEPEAGAGGGPAPAAPPDDPDGATELAVLFDGQLPRPGHGKRTHRAPEPEGDPEAVLTAPQIVRVGKVERVRGFQI